MKKKQRKPVQYWGKYGAGIVSVYHALKDIPENNGHEYDYTVDWIDEKCFYNMVGNFPKDKIFRFEVTGRLII